MHRINNIYCLNTLGEWIQAFNAGLIHLENSNSVFPENDLTQIISMGIHNCLSLPIVCYREMQTSKPTYTVYASKDLMRLTDFIKGHVCISINQKELHFASMDDSKKKLLLNAQLNSIWISL